MIQEPHAIAFLAMLAWAEGTSRDGRDPYRVTYGYRHTLRDLSDHPAATGEWLGMALPAQYCRRAGLRAGCKSTAAGAYQITLPTWRDRALRRLYTPSSFEPDQQDGFCWFALIEAARARQAIVEGRVVKAIGLCAPRWASLQGAGYGQPEKKVSALVAVYEESLGRLA